jgi:hypothetical protein
MRGRRGTYTGYSTGCAVVWAVILSVLRALGKSEKMRKILPVFAGWWLGVDVSHHRSVRLSATDVPTTVDA